MKKVLSVLLTLSLIIMMMPLTSFNISAKVPSLIIHYHRDDASYEEWKLWIWADSGEGSLVEFDYEDDFGKVAVISLPEGTKQAGFIVRTDSWEKDTSADRFVAITGAETEIWVYSEVSEFEDTVPSGYESFLTSAVKGDDANVATTEVTEVTGDYKLQVHYHRFDNDYEGWNLWLWPEGGAGAAYSFQSVDDYGAFIETTVPGSEGLANIGIIVRLNEWESKDIGIDRLINTKKVGEDGIIHLYLVQSDETLYYSEDAVDLSPKFISAELSGAERFEISVTVPFVLEGAKDRFIVSSESGETILVKYMTSTQSGENVGSATIVLEKPFNVGETYYVMSEGYEKFPISMTKAFDMPSFNEMYYYDGTDLGVTYTKESTSFRLWAPTASKVVLVLYEEGLGGEPVQEIPMTKDVNGTYITHLDEDIEGLYYTYEVTVGMKVNEAVDPYAKALGVNGDRGMIIDLNATNPEGWNQDQRPEFVEFTDAIIYELHVRDVSMSDDSGIVNKGKYLGLTETGTTNADGLSTGLDHIKELGITHLQLLPVFDYRSIDETKLEENNFNWGYDPKNYNAPEGSYSTDPYNGEVRINEFKKMVKSFHDNDIRVVMDVVYNHTGASEDSNLNSIVPNYYYRMDNGTFANGSGCGNETASEREMVRKMIVESVVFWASEYHIDGFRFDLMGLHDIETMNAVRDALNKVDPSIIIYGEGWTGGASPLKEADSCVKSNTFLLNGIGAFSDDLRDGIKGHVFESETPGFVNGALDMEESVKFGIVGATSHTQIDYELVNYSDFPWADSPSQSINYAEAHDNLTLWDKLSITNPDDSVEVREYMDKMSSAIFLTSQGVPFIHAGMEFLRTKDGVDNSYQSPDAINKIDWSQKTTNVDIFNYYKGLIELRKAHPAFRMTDASDIGENIRFFGNDPSFGQLQLQNDQMIAYIINNHANSDEAGSILVIFNAASKEQSMDIPKSDWTVLVNRDRVDVNGIKSVIGSSITLKPYESLLLMSDEVVDLNAEITVDDLDADEIEDIDESDQVDDGETSNNMASKALPIALGLVSVGIIGGFAFKKYKSYK